MLGVELTLALPCFNHHDTIIPVLQESVCFLDGLGKSWEILVVDDCSSDRTVALVGEATATDSRLRLIVHEASRLYSGACSTIVDNSRGRYIAIMDPDGQYTTAEMPAFLAKLQRGSNLVFGWRQQRDDGWMRNLISSSFNLLGQFWLGFPFHDLNVGMRMFDRRFLAAASIQHTADMINPELYLRARKARLSVDEVSVKHVPGKQRPSRDTIWKIVRYLSSLSRELNEPTIVQVGSDQTSKAA